MRPKVSIRVDGAAEQARKAANQKLRLKTFGFFRNSTLSLIGCHRHNSVALSTRESGPLAELSIHFVSFRFESEVYDRASAKIGPAERKRRGLKQVLFEEGCLRKSYSKEHYRTLILSQDTVPNIQ